MSVLCKAPPGSLDRMLSVLHTTWQSQAVRAYFPSISADSTLCLNCNDYSTTSVASTLATLATMLPQRHLDLKNVPVHCRGSSREESVELMHAADAACMFPNHVSFGGTVASKEPDVVPQVARTSRALRSNTGLTNLCFSVT